MSSSSWSTATRPCCASPARKHAGENAAGSGPARPRPGRRVARGLGVDDAHIIATLEALLAEPSAREEAFGFLDSLANRRPVAAADHGRHPAEQASA